MLVVFVHGWSVTNTATYGGLPTAIVNNAPRNLDIRVAHVFLSKYVSFSDEVTVDDLARGMQAAVSTEVLPRLARGERFACVTHSTGGPVVRKWLDLYFKNDLRRCPMQHLVMLAPANHGSALAQLGKGKLARMKFFAEGVQPGTGVLDWLELGSVQSWALNCSWLDYDCLDGRIFLFVLTGQSIDRHFYDNLNSYTGEAGSDGVVRVAAANMNYGLVQLTQKDGEFVLTRRRNTKPTGMGILPGRSHSGSDIGIMGSVLQTDDGTHPTVYWLLKCLRVSSDKAYRSLVKELDSLTAKTQKDERSRPGKEVFLIPRKFTTSRYSMLVFRLVDDRGNELSDYDVALTAGPNYDENHLAPGFFKDRQRNSSNRGRLTYYIDYDAMAAWLAKKELEGKFGLKVRARPEEGFAYYTVAEYRGTLAGLAQSLAPNQTVMVEIQLKRHVTEGVFRLTQDLTPEDFTNQSRGADLP